MRIVNISELRGDEVLGKPIIDLHGRVLLTKGIRIKDTYLQRLTELGISSLYIEDGISEGIEIENILCDETKSHAMSIVQKEMGNFSKSKKIDVDAIYKTANLIIENVLSNPKNLVNLKDLRIKDEYTFSHSVNVCTYSILLASKMGFPYEKLKNIGAGCLLHDFGKVLIPKEIIDKPGRLTDEEYEEIKKHPLYGYESIKNEIDISPTTKVVVLMHHEKLNGTGYPQGFAGESIHESARICSICDVFDAMTSDRSYRQALSFAEAAGFLESSAGTHFDKSLVELFLKCIPLYPSGTIVQLNTGAIGIIMRCNAEKITRPVIRLLYNLKTKVKYNNYVIDLMEDSALHIERVVNFNHSEYESL